MKSNHSNVNLILEELLGKNVMVTLAANQLNILGQTFSPIFTGNLQEVRGGSIKLNPVIVKMLNAPNHFFSTPLSFPIKSIVEIAPFVGETAVIYQTEERDVYWVAFNTSVKDIRTEDME